MITLTAKVLITVITVLGFATWAKYTNDPVPQKFVPWLFKKNLYYLLSSVFIGLLGTLWMEDAMRAIGIIEPLSYAVTLGTSSAGIGMLFGIPASVKDRKAIVANAVAK